MDIDEFYKLLRDEIDAGRIKEGSKKESRLNWNRGNCVMSCDDSA